MIKRAVLAVIPGSGKVWCKHSAAVAKLVEEGRDLVKRGNFSQARDLLRQALQVESTNIQARSLLEKVTAEVKRVLSVAPQSFLAPCGDSTAAPGPDTVSHNNLQLSAGARSYNITNASMGIKVRPSGKPSKLVVTANVLVRLDEGGLATSLCFWWESGTPSEHGA